MCMWCVMDLLAYMKEHKDLDRLPFGIHAVVHGDKPGVIFVLKNVNKKIDIKDKNRLHPFYMVYVNMDGKILINHLQPKDLLDKLRLACKGKSLPDKELCAYFNKKTKDGRDMKQYSALLSQAINSIIEVKEESDVDSLFSDGGTSALENEISGLNDFELICFLVVESGK